MNEIWEKRHNSSKKTKSFWVDKKELKIAQAENFLISSKTS